MLNSGTITGAGTIDITTAFTNAGAISPGGPGGAGKVAATATFTQTSTGVLNIDLGGLTPGVMFDQIVVSGAATLDGAVNVSLFGGYRPNPGDMFQFMTFASSTGSFASINDLNPGDGATFDFLYGSGGASLIAKGTPTAH